MGTDGGRCQRDDIRSSEGLRVFWPKLKRAHWCSSVNHGVQALAVPWVVTGCDDAAGGSRPPRQNVGFSCWRGAGVESLTPMCTWA